MARYSPKAKLLAAFGATLAALAVAYGVWCQVETSESSMYVEIVAGAEPEDYCPGQRAYAKDPVAGRRPSRMSIVRMPMVALDGTDQRETVKHRDANAFLRERPIPELADARRVLVVGDSHLDGIVDTADNLTTLLEDRADKSDRPTAFLNAGCGLYSLWQSVLRSCDLLPQYKPSVVVVLVFMGNDFLELDNPHVPHLDDQLRHCEGIGGQHPESTTARMMSVKLKEPYGQLFWQGLNQAEYLHRNPSRMPVVMAKAGHAVEHLEQAAKAAGCRVLWALLPSFDLAFPKRASGMGEAAARLVNSGVQRDVRDAFVAELEGRKAEFVDLEPAFRADQGLDLYAIDFHIYRRGHRVVARSLEAPVQRLLDGAQAQK